MCQNASRPGQIEIVVVVDNSAAEEELLVEHGLSFYIRDGGTHVLMDTGQGPALAPNAEQLGINLKSVEAVILSHGHFDHTGGLEHLFSSGVSPRIFTHPDAVRMRYGCLQAPPHKPIGMREEIAAMLADRAADIVHTTKPELVTDHLWVTGPIPRWTSFEDVGGPFYVDADCFVPDAIIDDQAAWVETKEGIVVLLGCAHAGVVNTLDYIAKLSGATRFHAVIGGMHLLNASPERIDATIDALKHYQVQLLAPCHCTGDSVIPILAEQFPGHYTRTGAGSRFAWSARE